MQEFCYRPGTVIAEAQSPYSDRFWSKVDVRGPEECWLWTAGTRNGYGRFKLFGKSVTAHRIAYELGHGLEVPPSLVVRHRCDNPGCCNPNHLIVGSQADNVNDAVTRWRHQTPKMYGFANGASVLHEDQVREILASDDSQTILAKRFGVSQSLISRIKRREICKDL